jgi:hypothetical protein
MAWGQKGDVDWVAGECVGLELVIQIRMSCC